LKQHSQLLYPFILPIINYCVDKNQPEHVYLYEDALELWEVTLENAPEQTPELLSLFPHLITLLDMGNESLRIVLSLIRAYSLLAPEAILSVRTSIK
jgi:hypothetical protein